MTYNEHRAGGFEGTQLVRLDPNTFRPLPGARLRLRDAATSRVLGAGGEELKRLTTHGRVVTASGVRLERTKAESGVVYARGNAC